MFTTYHTVYMCARVRVRVCVCVCVVVAHTSTVPCHCLSALCLDSSHLSLCHVFECLEPTLVYTTTTRVHLNTQLLYTRHAVLYDTRDTGTHTHMWDNTSALRKRCSHGDTHDHFDGRCQWLVNSCQIIVQGTMHILKLAQRQGKDTTCVPKLACACCNPLELRR